MRDELEAAATACETAAAAFDRDPLDAVITKTRAAARSLDASWSQSWAGYHARCYWGNFEAAQTRFNIEWGILGGSPYSPSTYRRGSRGWEEYDAEVVREEIRRRAGVQAPNLLPAAAAEARGVFAKNKREILTTLDASLSARPDVALKEVRDNVAALEDHESAERIIRAQVPQVRTRDQRVRYEGVQVPPHIQVEAEVMSDASCAGRLRDLAALARGAALYLRKRGIQRPWDLWVLGALLVGVLVGQFGVAGLDYAQRFTDWAARGLPRAARVPGAMLVNAIPLTLAALFINLASALIDPKGQGRVRAALRQRRVWVLLLAAILLAALAQALVQR